MKWCFLPIVTLLAARRRALAHDKPAADLIIRNARVWTVEPARPEAEAVAVLGERIVAVGSNAEADAWRGPRTRVVDAGGKRLLPGFNDAHVHFLDGGSQLDSIELKDAASPQEFAHRIGQRAAKTPKRAWILNGEWDETKWSPAALPTKDLIDPVTPDTPVAVSRYDGHMLVANSLALKLAGITAKTPDPPGGVIVRDARGIPTGALKDAAMDLLFRAVPPPRHEVRRRDAERALPTRPRWA